MTNRSDVDHHQKHVSPPKGLSTFRISLTDLSTHSMCLLLISSSSQHMRDVDFISCTCVDWSDIEHTDLSHIRMGILKHEHAVLPLPAVQLLSWKMLQQELFCPLNKQLTGVFSLGMFCHIHLEH